MLKLSVRMQWWKQVGAYFPPQFSPGNFTIYQEKRDKEGKWRGKEGKFEREEVENWKWKGIGMKMSRGLLFIYLFIYLLFLCLFIYLFCLSLFETTEVCLGSTNMDSFTRKIIFHAGTKSGNLTLPPPKNITPTPLHRFSDSTIYDYNDTWYSTPLSFNLKPLCLSKFEKHCVVWHLCWISALFFRFE